MVKYTIDNNRRDYVYYVSAVVAIMFTAIINLGLDSLSASTPALKFISNFHLTGFILFGLILLIFTNYLWKIKILSGIPDLNGVWNGNYIRYSNETHKAEAHEAIEKFNAEPTQNKIQITIEQNWLKMSIYYESAHSISTSTSIDFGVENKKVSQINYIFDSRPRTGLTASNKYGNGVCSVILKKDDGVEILEGNYYTQKGNRGFFIVKKLSK